MVASSRTKKSTIRKSSIGVWKTLAIRRSRMRNGEKVIVERQRVTAHHATVSAREQPVVTVHAAVYVIGALVSEEAATQTTVERPTLVERRQ